MFSTVLCPEAVELMVAYLFTAGARPHSAPASPLMGFYRYVRSRSPSHRLPSADSTVRSVVSCV
jgi:hypothetical protein